jgi:UDP-N-acetylmuramoylalanine--D-glutamate ligase
VFLNFSPDHLDRHRTVDEYAAAKAKIFSNQTAEDWAVINADDPHTALAAHETHAQTVTFSLKGAPGGLVIRSNTIVDARGGTDVPLVPLSSIRLIGRHLIADVMAASAVARIAGVRADAMVAAVESFTGLEHALERVMTISGVQFVNDSKATNVESAQRAIESFDRGLVVILGGRYKGGDWGLLAAPLASRDASVIAIGESQDAIEQALGRDVRVHRAANLSDAVRQGFTIAPIGGTVLLSPACASFDMFRDYAERGRMFKAEVAKLAAESSATREQ